MTCYNLTYEQKQIFDMYECLTNPAGQTWVGGCPRPTHTSQITILATPLIYIRAGEKLLLEKYNKNKQEDN